jgi:hypothetical protein
MEGINMQEGRSIEWVENGIAYHKTFEALLVLASDGRIHKLVTFPGRLIVMGGELTTAGDEHKGKVGRVPPYVHLRRWFSFYPHLRAGDKAGLLVWGVFFGAALYRMLHYVLFTPQPY